MSPKLIENVSDTARWVAFYRAMESERSDALFRDPWAKKLAGERGAAIVRHIPRARAMAWALIVRTQVFDELILQAVRQGADVVLNLAAGFDTRPYRLPLPPSLRWIEVDLPELLAHKERELAGDRPVCELERCGSTWRTPRGAARCSSGSDGWGSGCWSPRRGCCSI